MEALLWAIVVLTHANINDACLMDSRWEDPVPYFVNFHDFVPPVFPWALFLVETLTGILFPTQTLFQSQHAKQDIQLESSFLSSSDPGCRMENTSKEPKSPSSIQVFLNGRGQMEGNC